MLSAPPQNRPDWSNFRIAKSTTLVNRARQEKNPERKRVCTPSSHPDQPYPPIPFSPLATAGKPMAPRISPMKDRNPGAGEGHCRGAGGGPIRFVAIGQALGGSPLAVSVFHRASSRRRPKTLSMLPEGQQKKKTDSSCGNRLPAEEFVSFSP